MSWNGTPLLPQRGGCSMEDLRGSFFVDSLILLRFSAGIWVALVACRGLCPQWHVDCCPARKQKTGQTVKDRCLLSNEKQSFSGTMQEPSLHAAKGGRDALRLNLTYSYTRTSWSFPSLQKSQRWLWALCWPGVLLLPWNRSCSHHGNSLQFNCTFHCELIGKQKIPDQKKKRRGKDTIF